MSIQTYSWIPWGAKYYWPILTPNPACLNPSCVLLLDFGSCHGLDIMNTVFKHMVLHKGTRYQTTLGQRLMIDFVVISSAICFGHSGEERSRAVYWSPPGGELDKMAGEAARQTWKTQTNCEGELGEFGKGPIDLEELFLCRSYSLIPTETWDMEAEWGLFKASIVGVAASRCGWKGVYCERTCWWTLTVREAVM